ncbi:MAG TPA: Gfo/Idh/MocA family oxidoreductase [Candidatus Paceibacterota bacterium]|nr:Gfo/Idh/MocA family oxidoreductase [Verrucomicrobiota bacterium]HSA10210.1 Gfo/Idh/MocA family oxidoreductase [Candidatus Paceibacterota bacterium]
MQTNSSTRRQFLKQTTTLAFSAAALPVLAPASALGRAGKVAPGGRITVGCIGVGPQGQGDMTNFLNQKDAQVVAVCDVFQTHLNQARDRVNQHYQNNNCATYGDFRELLARKDVDAVLIATPDHWHVLNALAAVRAGKDVYLEKPLGLNLTEDWALRKAVHRTRRVFQFGTQQRSSRIFRLACALVRNGRIGRLRHINAWGPASASGGSTKVVPVLPGLDYEFWLGPAPSRPHTENLVAGPGAKKTWWHVRDFAVGFIAGWGIHPMDIAAWGGGGLLHGPIEVEGRGTFRAEGICDTATAWNVNMKFGSGVTLRFEGSPHHPNPEAPACDIWEHEQEWKQRYRRITDHGTAFEGTDGWVHVDRAGINLQPENLIDENEDAFQVQLARSPDHVRNFLDCIKSRAQTVCPIDEAVQSDTLCHLSEIALHFNRKLVWDPMKERFPCDEEANFRLLGREMREPWAM